jgi:hypothetical protein
LEFVERWAKFIKDKPQEEWRPRFNDFINAQFKIAERFRNNLEKTQEGRKALKRVIEWRKKR